MIRTGISISEFSVAVSVVVIRKVKWINPEIVVWTDNQVVWNHLLVGCEERGMQMQSNKRREEKRLTNHRLDLWQWRHWRSKEECKWWRTAAAFQYPPSHKLLLPIPIPNHNTEEKGYAVQLQTAVSSQPPLFPNFLFYFMHLPSPLSIAK